MKTCSVARNLFVALLMLMTMHESNAQSTRSSTVAGRSTVYSPRGTIATSHPLASGAGLEVLLQGGNAFDAAVTAAAVLGVVEPHMTGIGGDMFAILWLAEEEKLLGLNGSGRAGSLMTLEEMERRGHDSVPIEGFEPITVPGALAGWAELLKSHGTITLARALRPAIRLARDGFPVSPIIADQWAGEIEKLRRNPEATRVYLPDGQRAPVEGEWFVNADLARTYQTIATEGPETFYGGTLGKTIVDHLAENGGFLTVDDLKKHQSEWIKPVSVEYKGYKLWELPPNGQGIAALEMLRILEPYDLASMGHNSAQYLHYLIEAKKLAYADLAYYVADPDYMNASVDDLLSDRFTMSRRAKLNARGAAERPDPGELITKSDTIYLSAADEYGNMISFINSVSWEFGSGVVVPGTGFVLQNRGTGFTLEPGMANTLAAGKRPFHTLVPAFVTRTAEDGSDEPWLSFGVMGGSMQPQGHIQVLLNLLIFDMDLQEAIDAPRFRHIDGLDVALEAPITEVSRAGLRSLGHNLIDWNPHWFGGAQAVMKLERGWAAASDPRKDGMAVGH